MENSSTCIDYRQEEIFREFFLENYPKLLLFADRYLNDTSIAADVAQESFIRLWRSDLVFPSEDKMVGFLYTTARNISLNHLKHGGIVALYEQATSPEAELFFRDAVIEEETYEIIYQAIDRLAPQSRKIILLMLEGKSNAEIAEQLGISVNSVRTLKQNAYKKLRVLLKEHFFLFLLLINVHYFDL